MSWTQVIECDAKCGTMADSHPDEGPPMGWFQLSQMTDRDGCWDSAHEWHFCSKECVLKWPLPLL